MTGTADTAGDEQQLEKLYDRFTKFFGMLDSDKEGERSAALHKAWKAMQEINEIEARIYPEEQRSRLSFYTLFEKAAGGGGAETPGLEEALAANTALKESEMVALARLERVEFLYREMKKKAYTELLKDGTVSRSTVKGFQKYTNEMAQTAESLEKTFGPVMETLAALREQRESGDGTTAAVDDPLLLMLHKVLREDLDFVRIMEEGRRGDMPLRERIARALVKIPLDEKDLAVWRRMNNAQARVIEEQQTALTGMQNMPDTIRDLKETLLVMTAEQEIETVPRATHDEALRHLDTLQTEADEARETREKLEKENKELKAQAATADTLKEQLAARDDTIEKQEGRIEALYGKRRHTLLRMRAYGRDLRRELGRAHELNAALQTGNLENVVAVLKAQGVLDDSEKAQHEKTVAALERKVQQKDAELNILQERIDIWVSEHEEQEKKISRLQRKAALNYGLIGIFAAAAGTAGFLGAGALSIAFSEAAGSPAAAAVVIPALIVGAIGGIVGMVMGASEDGLKGGILGTVVGGALSTMVSGLLFMVPAMIMESWAESLSKKYCPAAGCEMTERPADKPPQVTVNEKDGSLIIELRPAP